MANRAGRKQSAADDRYVPVLEVKKAPMAEHWKDKDDVIHCEGVESGDYLLCGLAPEGENGDDELPTKTHAPINCSGCVAIITFCRRIRPGEFASTVRAQR